MKNKGLVFNLVKVYSVNMEKIEKTTEALNANHFIAEKVNTKEEALERIKQIIPDGASIMNGASLTLDQIGYLDLLKSGEHKWHNLHTAILAETDKIKQGSLRKQGVLSDFYLGSVHALTEIGEMIIASNSGSQLSHLVFTSPNIILVIGENKIVPTISDGLKRLEEYVIPLEDERMKKMYGFGTQKSKTLILHKENPGMGRKVYVLIVNEGLGF